MTDTATNARGAERSGKGHRPRLRPPGPAFWFLVPFSVMFLLFFVLPIIYAIWQSLFVTERSGLLGHAHRAFAGLANYVAAVHDADFVASIGRILLFGVVEVPVMIVFSLILALVLDSAAARFTKFFRTAFFAPYGVPGVVASLLWGFLYTPGISPIVELLGDVGIKVDFFSSGATLWSIANIVVWEFAGYNMLVLIAQLQSIPRDLYESARVDGAGGWRIAWSIKIPLVKPALILITVFSIIGTLQLFAEPLVLRPNDSNISSTYTPNLVAYTEAFTYNNYSYAAAEAVILAVLALILSFTFLKISQRGGRP